MKHVLLVGLMGLCMAVSAEAAVLEWDRNAETDMLDYQIWACFTPSCVVVKSPTSLLPETIPQTAEGARPSFEVDILNREGAFAVSARDQSRNESGLSVQVPFDRRAPAVPTNPAWR